MKIACENGNVYEINTLFNKDSLTNLLDTLDPNNNCYIIVEKDNGDFIQCAGAKNRLTVEARFNINSSFKHFVIGKRESSKIWTVIECKVGPINVLTHEILDIYDAIELILHFIQTGSICNNYNSRNITKYFKS